MSTAHKNSMRGLTVFITDIRNCQNKEDEEKRVNKEMAKIRKCFKEGKDIQGYDRRKYVSKILYMFMLGYDIDFGYMEAVTLLSSNKFQEKLVGYLALAILLHENHEMLPLIIQSLQNDLQSRNEYFQALALTAIGNIGGKEMAESLAPIVQKLLISKATKATIKKKSALCLLRLFRKYPELITPDVWLERLVTLLDEHDLGILTSVMGLLLGLATENPKGYEPVGKKAVWLLTKIIINKDYTKDYVYYNMANPWLQVKLLRFLSLYPPPSDPTAKTRLYEILKKVLSSADVAKGQTVNHKNALNAVLFEAIALAIHFDDDRELIRQAAGLLGRFISPKEHSNIRYLALASLGQLAGLDSETATLVKKHQDTVILALRDPDISIRKRALDLLYTMCDKNNSKAIVSELLNYLVTADFAIREELVLKVAILAEKFASHYSWYVDVILQLISLAGDFVSDDIWFRVVQIVTNHQDIQEYAAKTVFKAVTAPNCHETAIKVGGYILGEFGHLIAELPNSGPQAQFSALHSKFGTCSPTTKALLLSTYVKFVNLYPEMTEVVRNVLKQHDSSLDAEIQQRACEYLKLTLGSEELLQAVWDVMPAFPERDINSIGQGQDKSAGQEGSPDADADRTPKTRAKEQLPQSASPPAPTKPAYDPMKELEDIFGGMSSPATQQPSNVGTSPSAPRNATGIDDLLGGYGSSSTSPAQSTPALDLSSMLGGAPSSGAQGGFPSSGSSSFPTSGSQAPQRLPKKVTLMNEGVLYQDGNIQIGFKSEYSQGAGRMMLYYGNVSTQPLQSFGTAFSTQPAILLNAQPVAAVVEPRTQAQQMVAISCSAEFTEPPSIDVRFTVGGNPVRLVLRLPIVVCKFIEPHRMNGGDFFARWKEIEGQPLSEQVIIKSASGEVDVPSVSKLLSTGFHFAILQGVDPNSNNLVGAGNFRTSTSQQILCLLRVETNPAHAMYRVTLKTTNAQITAALKELLEEQLGA